jgi:hypothetical protein
LLAVPDTAPLELHDRRCSNAVRHRHARVELVGLTMGQVEWSGVVRVIGKGAKDDWFRSAAQSPGSIGINARRGGISSNGIRPTPYSSPHAVAR